MRLLKTLSLVSLIALAAPGFAQEQTAGDGGEAEESPDPLALNMGEPDIKVGDVYQEGEFTDWEIRCVRAPEGQVDPCQLYQLLDDGQGNAVAEINIFPLAGGEGQPAAGATVVTPLETLLTEQLSLAVDNGAARRYPFSFCSQIGCFARLGFSEADIDAFRRGSVANVTIVPVVDATQRIRLEVSLSGFTAAYTALREQMAAEAAEQ